MRSRLLPIVLLLATPLWAGVYKYRYVSIDSSADPTKPVPAFYYVDTAAELPTANEGDTAYAADTAWFYTRSGGAWTAVGGGGGAPTDGEYVTYAANASLSAERVTTNSTSVTWNTGTAGQIAAERAALTGDVSAAANSNTTTIGTGAVTFAKIQDSSGASKLLGRGSASGAGDFEEITLGTNLSMSGTVLNASGGGSTPTGTGYRHVTAGAEDAAAKLVNLTASTDVAANQGTTTQLLHGNAAGQASWGAVVTADMADANVTYAKIQAVSAASKLLGRGDSGSGSVQEITLGSGLSMTGTTLAASGGSNPWTFDYLTADHSNSTTTPTTIPDISLAVSASTTYVAECRFVTSAAATTTGVQITVVGPASPTAVTITRHYSTNATTVGRLSATAFGALNATASAGTARAIDLLSIVLKNGANGGNITFQLDSEVSASNTTVFAGSWCEIRSVS